MSGTPIAGTVSHAIVFPTNNTAQHPPADFLGIIVPVFSDRLVDALQQHGVDNLQTFGAVLRNPDTGEHWEDRKAVNVIGLIACLDVVASNAIPMLPPLYDFDLGDFTIVERNTGGALLFRMAEAPGVILIERNLGDAIMETTPEFSGLEFRDVASS